MQEFASQLEGKATVVVGAGGNPFFLLETLQAMLEAGFLWQDEASWSTPVDATTEDYRELPLPDTVGQAIRDRLGRLSPQARQVLEAGAVFAHAEARAYFDHALILLEQEIASLRDPEVIATNQRLRVQMLAERGWTFRLLGDMEAWVRDLQEVARLATLLGD